MNDFYVIKNVRKNVEGGSYMEYAVRRGDRMLADVSCGTGRVRQWYDADGKPAFLDVRVPTTSDSGGPSFDPGMTVVFVIMREAFGEKAARSMAGRSNFENKVMGLYDGGWRKNERRITHEELFAEYVEATRVWKS